MIGQCQVFRRISTRISTRTKNSPKWRPVSPRWGELVHELVPVRIVAACTGALLAELVPVR